MPGAVNTDAFYNVQGYMFAAPNVMRAEMMQQDKRERFVIFILFCPGNLATMQDKNERFVKLILFYHNRFSEMWDKI